MTPRAPRVAALTVAAFALALSACSAEVSVGSSATIDQAEVEQQVAAALEENLGEAPDDVTCPGDLDAEVGASTTCTASNATSEGDFLVTVTELTDEGTAKFRIEDAAEEGSATGDEGVEESGDEVALLSESELEELARLQVELDTGESIDAVDCPGEIPMELGSETACTVILGGEEYGASVTIDDITAEGDPLLSVVVDG